MPKVGQNVDTARLSLDEFCVVTSCLAPDPTSGPLRRDITDALATVYWYRWVRRAAGHGTPYAISRLVEPNSHWSKGSGERFHRNKWPKYARGQHRPNDGLVNATERLFPGSARQIRHPLWEVLKRPPRSARSIEKFEAMLRPDVQALILRWRPRGRCSTAASVWPLAKRLERTQDLDALTALILQLHEARLAGQPGVEREWARHVYRCLLLISEELLLHGIAQPLFELIDRRVLQSASNEGWRYAFPASRYLAGGEFLEDVLWHIKGVECTALTNAQRVRHMQKVLDGDYGFDCLFALNPFRTVAAREVALPENLLRQILTDMHLFLWSWNMRHERQVHPWLPPKEVFDGADLHARAPDPLTEWQARSSSGSSA